MSQFSISFLSGIVFFFTFWIPFEPVFAQAGNPRTTVHVRIRTEETGKTTPAMVCVTDPETDQVRLPPDGRVMEEPGTTSEFYQGIKYQESSDWVGPARKTTGKGDRKHRARVYGNRPSLPFWKEPVRYLTPGTFSIRLPEGTWRLAVSRGMEFVPVIKRFKTSGNGERTIEVKLERWIDLAGNGWYSGDVHVHHPTRKPGHRSFLLKYAQAEDLRLVNVLEMSHHEPLPEGTAFKQEGFGKKFRVQRDGRWLISGQEGPRSQFGHIIGLNINSLVHNHDTYDLYDIAFRDLHEQGAVVGYAHFAWNGCKLPRGFPWYVTTGKIDFVELLQFGQLNRMDYYDYLNLGFRLSAAAGSDIPWGSTIGEVRTYVHTGSPLDPDQWFEGLRKGQTFVTNGPALKFTVDDELPGSEIKRTKGTRVRVQAEVLGHPNVALPKSLKVVSNDGVLREAKAKEGRKTLTLDVQVKADRSRWFTAAATCTNGAVAQSSPVYMKVDGQPVFDPERGPAIIKRQLKTIDRIEKEFSGNDSKSQAIRERLERARSFYAELEKKMGQRR